MCGGEYIVFPTRPAGVQPRHTRVMQTALVAFLDLRADLRADRCRPAIAAEQGRPLGRMPVVSLSRAQAGHEDLGARPHEMVIAVGHVGWVAPSQDPGTSWRTR